MIFEDDRPLKRSSSAAGLDNQFATKRQQGTSGYQEIAPSINGTRSGESIALDDEVAETLLRRSISLALNVVGFEASETLALESFRVAVEECMGSPHMKDCEGVLLNISDMHRFAANVRQCMLACRRTQATAQDFLQALHTHQLSLRSLLPHLRPPVPKRRARVAISCEPPEEEERYDHHFLGASLNHAPAEQNSHNLPRHFPPLPSKHTYKATAELPEREEDPRKIRERATEEGRLGEEALRRLVSAKLTNRPSSSRAGQGTKSLRTKRDELWKEAMEAASVRSRLKDTQDDDTMELDLPGHEASTSKTVGFNYGRVSSAVNADKKFWRKPTAARRRDPNGSNGGV